MILITATEKTPLRTDLADVGLCESVGNEDGSRLMEGAEEMDGFIEGSSEGTFVGFGDFDGSAEVEGTLVGRFDSVG